MGWFGWRKTVSAATVPAPAGYPPTDAEMVAAYREYLDAVGSNGRCDLEMARRAIAAGWEGSR